MNIGEWLHISVTYDYNQPIGTEPKFYYNGVDLELSWLISPSGSYVLPTASKLVIGRRYDYTYSSFEGVIDDVRIYNRVLTSSEIQVLANCTRPGSHYYNSADNVAQWCKDVWEIINMAKPVSGVGSCSPIDSIRYNTDRSQSCVNGGWVNIGK